ncbi:acyl-CoA dehydrogenase [Dissoconium aciculare CBS 342.82]|uniref:Acyl-CoA dehydrogenase n=1 Tax=Dissoconium aciculare CBS 342.82 TaxID=1314786 RepID=A0A6J3MD54_9PEZI|nr:acyl-CoA dehydrogenase [Dissoconium aciculare CBS 342.82]KAF1825529.1 acyl-CoA dehydrogenase [Dissoconium aciculare CBS 342.82]
MSEKVVPAASSATTGFFQAKPQLTNQYHEDHAFRRALDLFLPAQTRTSIDSEFSQLGDKVLSPQVLFWLRDAEVHQPTLVLRDSFGSPRNELITSEGWRQLQDFGFREGMVATGYEGKYGHHTRVVQFAKIHLFAGSSSTVTCPSAMQDGAAKLIMTFLADGRANDPTLEAVLQRAYKRLTSRDPTFAWTSGQWMTERTGGSDVSGTETRATPLSESQIHADDAWTASDGSPLGPFSVDGFKWFSSATDANMCFFLAKTPTSERVSLFFGPVRRLKGDSLEFNGIFPQRLKNKLGTKALPTAELELKGMRAYMLGQEGAGTKEISPILNITRVYNAVSSVGSMARGLAISRAFARVRTVAGGQPLMNTPAHVRSMAIQHVEYRGQTMIVYFITYLLGITEHSSSTSQPNSPLLENSAWTAPLLRILTPVVKAMSAAAAVDGLRACMESMGGLGYLENEDVELNVAKIYRDTNVLTIWEGTTDVLAADTVRVLKGRGAEQALKALAGWAQNIVRNHESKFGLSLKRVIVEIQDLVTLVQRKNPHELLYLGRDLLDSISWIVITLLLVADATRDNDAIAVETAKRWLARKDEQLAQDLLARPWIERAKLDQAVVFGPSPQFVSATAKI